MNSFSSEFFVIANSVASGDKAAILDRVGRGVWPCGHWRRLGQFLGWVGERRHKGRVIRQLNDGHSGAVFPPTDSAGVNCLSLHEALGR